MKNLKTTGTLILIAGLFVFSNSCGNENQKAQKTSTNDMENSEVYDEAADSSSMYYIEIDLSKLEELSQGDKINLSLIDQDKSYTLVVRRAQETMPGILSISANIEDRETGLASLNFREGRLTGMLDFYKENTRYRVSYDPKKNMHFILEVLPSERDEKEGGDPMTPKLHNGQN
ncbi:MAG: hypothetical protein WD022_12065 [Balneolaceae bacterium]